MQIQTLGEIGTRQDELAIASLYLAASGEHSWQAALHDAAALFGAERIELALLAPDGVRPFHLTAALQPEALAPASSACTASQATLGAAVLRVPVHAGTTALVALRWPDRQATGDGLAASLQRWAGHLQIALRCAHRRAEIESRANLVQTLLDALPHPGWILSPQRKVIHSNAAAQSALQQQASCLRMIEGQLGLRHARLDRAFAERVLELARAPAGSSTTLDIRGDRAALPRLLHLRKEGPVAGTAAPWSEPWLVVSLFDTQGHAGPPAALLSTALGLTDAEGRVASLLAAGHTPEQIAELQGTCISTVRSQLVQVFRKLGVARQTDVVRVLWRGQSLWQLMAA